MKALSLKELQDLKKQKGEEQRIELLRNNKALSLVLLRSIKSQLASQVMQVSVTSR